MLCFAFAIVEQLEAFFFVCAERARCNVVGAKYVSSSTAWINFLNAVRVRGFLVQDVLSRITWHLLYCVSRFSKD